MMNSTPYYIVLSQKNAGTKEYIKILQLTESHGVHRIAHFLNDLSKKNNDSLEELKSYIRFKQNEEKLTLCKLAGINKCYERILQGAETQK